MNDDERREMIESPPQGMVRIKLRIEDPATTRWQETTSIFPIGMLRECTIARAAELIPAFEIARQAFLAELDSADKPTVEALDVTRPS